MTDDAESAEQGQVEEIPAPPEMDTRLDPDEFLPIRQALAKVMGEVQWIGKGGEFKEGQGDDRRVKYKFRGVDQVVNAVGPMLRKYGVLVIPEAIEHRVEHPTTGQGKTMVNVVVKMAYRLYSLIDGEECILGSAWGEGFDSGDKATAKAESVAYRVFWLQALAIPTDEPDPDSQSFERGSGQQAERQSGQGRRSSSSGQRRQSSSRSSAPASDKVGERQAKQIRDALAEFPEGVRAEVLAAFRAEFNVTKADDVLRTDYTRATRWLHEQKVGPQAAAEGDPPADGEGDADGEDPPAAADGPSFSEVREQIVARDDRRWVQKHLAHLGLPATGPSDELTDRLAAAWARQGGIPESALT